MLPAFPELVGAKIGLNYAHLADGASFECGAYCDGNYWITVDTALSKAPRDAVIGGLAHELCHLILDKRETPKQSVLYKTSKSRRALVERNTDLAAVARGFCPQLLVLARFNETRHRVRIGCREYNPEAGLSAAELEELVRN